MSLALTLFRAGDTTTFLRRLLAFDAITSGAMGLKLAAGAGFLGPMLNIPVPFLREAGLILIPFAIAVGLVAFRAPTHRAAILTIAAVNALWVVASFGVLIAGLIAPNGLGMAFVAAQAVFVALLAELQVMGVKRLAAE
jgi:hypothetical protein